MSEVHHAFFSCTFLLFTLLSIAFLHLPLQPPGMFLPITFHILSSHFKLISVSFLGLIPTSNFNLISQPLVCSSLSSPELFKFVLEGGGGADPASMLLSMEKRSLSPHTIPYHHSVK